jgi:hypothetical protein
MQMLLGLCAEAPGIVSLSHPTGAGVNETHKCFTFVMFSWVDSIGCAASNL